MEPTPASIAFQVQIGHGYLERSSSVSSVMAEAAPLVLGFAVVSRRPAENLSRCYLILFAQQRGSRFVMYIRVAAGSYQLYFLFNCLVGFGCLVGRPIPKHMKLEVIGLTP